ncbi:MAG: hydroxyacid dehydrogenase [Bacillota bacterium]|nr:hydroxyacid dehydrogenase [Bacillota bacterium]
MAKVVIVQPIRSEGIDLLLKNGFEVRQLADRSLDSLKREVADADAMLVRDARIPREVIECGKKLKVISRHGAGLENIDVDAATEHGIQVTNTPVANSTSVAEHVLGLILSLAKNLQIMDRAVRDGRFEIRHQRYGLELEGKTLGIIGLGRIGRRLAAKAALGLGMKVLGYDPYADPAALDPAILEVTGDWDRVFQESDFVSLNLPLTEKTRGIVGKRDFALMKRTAFFINCSRGQVVVEGDLIEALQEGLIAGAGLDVYETDPPSPDNPLLKMENTVLTPHSAAHTEEAMVNMAVHAAQGIVEVLNGRPPTWPVNKVRSRD